MAAVARREERDLRIFAEGGESEGFDGDEGIVLGGEDESGAGDAGDDISGAGLGVVIGGIAEAAEFCGDDVIELADGADGGEAAELRGGIAIGKERGFADHVSAEAFDEVALIDEIRGPGESIGAGSEVERGGDGDEGAKLRGGGGGPFAGHFENQIAAHGKTGGENFRERIAGGEFGDDAADIYAEAGVIESGREAFGAAAIALVEAENVEAGEPGFFGGAENGGGFAGTLEAVKKNERGMSGGEGLPVAIGANLRAGLGVEKARYGGGKAREAAPPENGGESHGVRIPEEEGRGEIFHKNMVRIAKRGRKKEGEEGREGGRGALAFAGRHA